MLRIAVVFLFAGTLGALLGGTLTSDFLPNQLVAATDGASSAPASGASKAKASIIQVSLQSPRRLAVLATRKVSHQSASGLIETAGINDDLYDDITVAPRSHKLMISALHVSARMAVSGG